MDEGSSLAFTATATDADEPAQNLTFTLDPGAPEGAGLSPLGEFAWTPGEADGGTTNLITVRVTHDGTPPLSAAATFTVTVATRCWIMGFVWQVFLLVMSSVR